MCGRMTPLTYDEVLSVVHSMRRGAVLNPFPDWPAVAPRPDAFPRSEVPVVVPVAGASLQVQQLNWGYPVSWQAQPMFNTRIESLEREEGMWRASRDNRCVVPTVRFYELHETETVRSANTGRQKRRMYEFHLVDEPVTWLAGVYEGGYFSVVTTRPNSWVAAVHARMPVVLRVAELSQWLGAGYVQLADRDAVPLEVRPEMADDEQLSLF